MNTTPENHYGTIRFVECCMAWRMNEMDLRRTRSRSCVCGRCGGAPFLVVEMPQLPCLSAAHGVRVCLI